MNENGLDPKTIRLTREACVTIAMNSMVGGEYAEKIITAQLRKAADVLAENGLGLAYIDDGGHGSFLFGTISMVYVSGITIPDA